MSIANVVRDLVTKNDAVTFFQINEALHDAGIDWKGDCAFGFEENVCLWFGISEEYVAAIHKLLNAREVFIHPASRLMYLMDQCTVTMPIAQRIPSGGYKKPHWLPVCLRSVPFVTESKDTPPGSLIAIPPGPTAPTAVGEIVPPSA